MDANIIAVLKEGSILSLVNELIVHRELATRHGQTDAVAESLSAVETLQCTIEALRGTVRDVEQRLTLRDEEVRGKQVTIEDLRSSIKAMKTIIHDDEEDLQQASYTIGNLTIEVAEQRETLKWAQETRISLVKKAQRRTDTIAELLGEIFDAEATIARQLDLLKGVHSLRRPFAHLPQEIIHAILTMSVCDSAFLDPTLHSGIYSAWQHDLGMKKSFCLVCKTWRSIGLALLYETVFISRIGQISLLMDVLESDGSIGALIKSIDISCVAPHGYHSPQTRHALLCIFSYCPRLAKVTFGTTIPYCRLFETTVLLLPAISYLTGFESTHSQSSNASHLVALLAYCRNLKSLNLLIESFTVESLPVVTLDVLETLRLTIHDAGLGVYQAISGSWNMPSLQNLVLTEKRLSGTADTAQREVFFAKYGHGLTYLSMRPAVAPLVEVETFPIHLQQLLNSCPALEHLAISPSCVADWPRTLSHPNIKWVDFWQPTDPRGSSTLEYFPASKLPSLQRLRRLDGRPQGLPSYIDWSSILPPWTPLGEMEREYRHLGIIIRQTPSFIYRSDTTADVDWSHELVLDLEATEYSSSDDSTYAPSEEDSDDSFYSDDESVDIDYDTGFLYSNEDVMS